MKTAALPVAMKDISIICQGAVVPILTARCLHSMRTVFPGAEVIFSTWDGSSVDGLDVDKSVFSADPGAFMADEVAGVPNNVNRQLVSTRAGITAATRPYILKTRTDILFESADFLSYFGKFDRVPSPYFKNRLLICNYYTRNPRAMALCFHPSDWVVFGAREDVKKYYGNTPLMTDEEGHWFNVHEKASSFFTNFICRFTPEQHVFLGFFRQYENADCNCYYSRTKVTVSQTERAFSECFVVLNYGTQIGIRFAKYKPNRYWEKYTIISHRQWKQLYVHYCKQSRGICWKIYLLRSAVMRAFAWERRMCVCALDRLGIKESMKRVLSKWMRQ